MKLAHARESSRVPLSDRTVRLLVCAIDPVEGPEKKPSRTYRTCTFGCQGGLSERSLWGPGTSGLDSAPEGKIDSSDAILQPHQNAETEPESNTDSCNSQFVFAWVEGGVLANYVYNSLVSGRPYFFQMIDDAKIAKRFAEENLGVRVAGVTASGEAFTVAAAIAEVTPRMKFLCESDSVLLQRRELVEKKQEAWPIPFLVPGGAYIQQANSTSAATS